MDNFHADKAEFHQGMQKLEEAREEWMEERAIELGEEHTQEFEEEHEEEFRIFWNNAMKNT